MRNQQPNNFIIITKQNQLSHFSPMQDKSQPTTPLLQILSPLPKLHSSISLPPEISGSKSLRKLHELFNIPDFRTNKQYQKTIRNVVQLLNEFDKFTDNLEQKVDYLLASQRNQFVQSYKNHMKRVQVQFHIMQQQVTKQQDLIKYYENQGKMSNLIKKVALLEQQSKRLYEVISKKDKEIKSFELQSKVQKQQQKRLHLQMKQLLKRKNEAETKMESYSLKNHQRSNKSMSLFEQQQTENFFATEVMDHQKNTNINNSINKDLSTTTLDKPKPPMSLTQNLSNNSLQVQAHLSNNPELHSSTTYERCLKKQIQLLTQKNRKIAKLNNHILEQKNELEQIFIKAVHEIKRQITVKKNIRYCSYEDFTKEDKINLLLTIISNEQILRYVYERIFGSTGSMKRHESSVLGQQNMLKRGRSTLNRGKDKLQMTSKSVLPSI